MKQKITEKTLRKIIRESIVSVLSEATNNYPLSKFIKDMQMLGFESIQGGRGSAIKFVHPLGCEVLVDIPHGGNGSGNVKADTLRHVKTGLEKVGWFNNPENRNKFPFDAWGFSKNTVHYDNSDEIEQEEIEDANNQYADATVYPIFPQMKNSICALEVDKDHVNLCRSTDDRRPLYDEWFNECRPDRKTGSRMCLKKNNFETLETEAYPINTDGTLDIDNMIIENKRRKNGKCIVG